MSVNLDADVGQILKDLFNKKKASKGDSSAVPEAKGKSFENYKNAILKSALFLCITAGLTWFVHDLSQNPMQRDESEFATNEQLEEEFKKLKQNIESAKLLLERNKEKAQAVLPEFSEMEGSKSLFKLISATASENSLIISNIIKGKTVQKTKPIEYYNNTVNLEIEGYYQNLMEFKRQLNEKKAILRIDEESIILTKSNYGERKLVIELTLDDYALNKKTYEDLLQSKI